MRQLHVAVAQIHALAHDPQRNLGRIHRQVRAATAVGVEAILFAETAIHAYCFTPENKALAEPLGGPLTRQLSIWAQEYQVAILAGFLERDGDCLYNSQAIAFPDGTLGVERKSFLTEIEFAAGLTAGPRTRTIFHLNGIPCAILICADSGLEGIHAEVAAQGVEFLFTPCAGGGVLPDYLHETDLATPEGRAKYATRRPDVFTPEAILPEETCRFPGFAAANALGFDGVGMCHQGHCTIVDRQRVVRAQIPGTLILEHHMDQMVHALITF